MDDDLKAPVKHQLDDVIRAEARGDASNLKGTDYHLLYAIWLLVTNKAETVHFFAGNDLLAKPISPPSSETETDLLLAGYRSDDADLWIQLKSTASPWTCSSMFDDNLLDNFICNTFLSDSKKRAWRVELATTADIRCKEIEEFVANPTSHRDLSRKLDAVVSRVTRTLAATWSEAAPRESVVRQRALEVLQSLAGCEPLPRRALYAEILTELAFQVVDRQLAHELQQKLVGAILQDSSAAAGKVCVYDRDWARKITGHGLWSNLPLDVSVASACNEQVSKRVPSDFSADEYVSRTNARNLIEEFVRSAATVFLLSGGSGTGKSWLLAHWAAQTADSRARLFIPGQVFVQQGPLAQLVASELRPLTAEIQDDNNLFQKLVRASHAAPFGPLVIAIDDIRPAFGGIHELTQRIALLVDDARRYGIKLVFTCQTDVMRNLRPFSQVRPQDVFHSEPRSLSPTAHSLEPTTSCLLEDFTDDELKDIVNQQFGGKTSERMLHRLRDPALAPLRNPYALRALIEETKGSMEETPNLAAYNTAMLIDRRIEHLLTTASQTCHVDVEECRRVLLRIVAILRRDVERGVGHTDLAREVEEHFASVGRDSLDAFRTAGLLHFSPRVGFSDAKIGARLNALYLVGESTDFEYLRAQLFVERDHDVVVQLCTLLPEPVTLASQMVEAEPRWIPSFAEGLACCDPADDRVGAVLLGFSRRETEGWAATDALGRFALRSRAEWKHLLRQFLGTHDGDRELAERALWHVGKLAPELVVRAIRLRFRARRVVPDDRKVQLNRRRDLAKALRAAGGIDSDFAAKHVLALLRQFEHALFEGIPPGEYKDSVELAASDPLLKDFDQVRILAAAYGDESAFNGFLADLTASDDVRRIRAVNALQLVGRVMPDRVRSKIHEAIRTETVPPLLARILWNCAGLADSDSESVLDAMESNLPTCWKTYEAAAGAYSLLELLARHRPDRVIAMLPPSWEGWDDEWRLLLCELDLVCRFRCRQEAGEQADVLVEPLAEANIQNLQPLHVFYLLRSSIVTETLRIGEDIGLTDSPLIWRMELRDQGPDFFKLDLSGWIKNSEKPFSAHPRSAELIQSIIAAANSAHKNSPDVLDKWRRNVRFFVVGDCLDLLASLLVHRDEPADYVKLLPNDFEALYVSRRLIEMGARSNDLIEFALRECENHRRTATAQASADRNDCLIALQKVVPNRVPQVESDRDGIGWFLSGGRSTGSRLTAQIDANASRVIEQLESLIKCPSDAMMLAEWESEATNWSTVLLSRAYSRMFHLTRILPADAMQLSESTLLVFDSLPGSAAAQEHHSLYKVILQRLRGTVAVPPDIRDASCPIVASHQLAAEILALPDDEVTGDAIRRFLADKRGWWESNNYRWDDNGHILHGSGISFHLLVFFPAVRLALCALGRSRNWYDPAYTWTIERRQATTLSQHVGFHLQYPSFDRKQQQEGVKQMLAELPDQERLHAIYGHLLLLDGKCCEARQSLETALKSPLCEGRDRAGVLYNLACAFARLGDEDQCRQHLLESNNNSPLDVNWMNQDPDLEAVRSAPWFAELSGAH